MLWLWYVAVRLIDDWLDDDDVFARMLASKMMVCPLASFSKRAFEQTPRHFPKNHH